MSEVDYQADGGEYNDAHRAFLQAFMARSVLTFEEAQPILAAILTAQDTDADSQEGGRETLAGDITRDVFHEFIWQLNGAISDLDYEIKNTRSQTDMTNVYALVNTTSDPLTELATTRTPDEIAFVKRLLDAMFATYNTKRAEIMCVTTTQGDNLAKVARPRESVADGEATQGSRGGSLTMAQADKVMEGLVDEGWFHKSSKGFLSLTPRAILELGPWLEETYNEKDEDDNLVELRIKTCQGCKTIVTVGQRCSNYECDARIHNICVQKFFTNKRPKQCPLCKTEWTGQDFVGERAMRGGRGGRPSTNGASSSSRRRASDDESE